MLTLSRRKNQSVMIGDEIVVQVVEICGNQVRLGFTAPGLPVHRGEVYYAIKRSEAAGPEQRKPVRTLAWGR